MRLSLTLYVNGDSPLSVRASANLRRLLAAHPEAASSEVEVVDVRRDPERAERDRILATPTLVKHGPTPVRRITGDLSDPARVLAALELFDG